MYHSLPLSSPLSLSLYLCPPLSALKAKNEPLLAYIPLTTIFSLFSWALISLCVCVTHQWYVATGCRCIVIVAVIAFLHPTPCSILSCSTSLSQNTKLPFSFPVFLLAWICREVLVYVVYVMALVNPSVIHWGRYSYYVRMGGLTSRLPSGAANTAGAGARHRRHQSSPLLMPNHMEDHHPLVSNGPVTHNARRCHDNSAYYSPTASDLNKHPQTHTNAFLPSSTVTGGSNHT